MTSELGGFLRRLEDPELAALSPELAQRLLTTLFRDSGFSLTVRDGAGRGRSLTEPATDLNVDGAPVEFDDSGFRYFDADGHELPRLRHPVHQVRMSGTRQQYSVMGLLGLGARQRWFLASTMPLARQPEGWSTLTIAADVGALLNSRHEAQARSEISEALLELASSLLASGASDPEAIAVASEQFAADRFPQCMVVLSLIEGDTLRLWPVQLQRGIDPPPERVLVSRVRAAWSDGVHVNQAVDDTDIYGSTVVGSLDNPFRSIVSAPIEIAGERHGSLAVVSLLRDAFSDLQIAALEGAAAMIGQARAPAYRRAA